MTIYAFGGEMGFFIPSDSSAIETTVTTPTTWDSAFARCSVGASSSGSYSESVSFTGLTDFYTHFAIQADSFAGGTLNIAVWVDGFGVECIRLNYTRASALLALQYWNGSVWTTAGSVTVVLTNVVNDMDLHALVDTASGALRLYIAGTSRIVASGIDLSGIGSISKVRSYGASSRCHISQVVIADEPTIGMRVGTIYMSGQGATHTFDVGGYTTIDETVYSDADFIQSGTADQIELFTGTSIPTFTGYTIRALALTARAKGDGTAPTKFEFCLRSGGTNYFSGDQTLDVGYGAFCNVWETNPATSAAFQSSEIAALQYGVKSIT